MNKDRSVPRRWDAMVIVSYLILISFILFHIGLIIAAVTNASDNESTEQSNLDDKFEEVYIELLKTNEYVYGIGDTNVRNMHYVKPHTSFQNFCPECFDLWGKKEEHVTTIPADRLEELRAIRRKVLSLPTPSSQASSNQPVDELTVEEELDSILFLLKQQQSHLYTNKYTVEMQYHYLKKHKHPTPGVQGKCPDCISLRKKQTTEVNFIPDAEYDELLRLEQKFKENKNDEQTSDNVR